MLVSFLSGEALQLDGETGDVDAVADGVAFVGGVRHLQKVGDVLEDALFGEGQVLAQDLFFLVAFREIDEDLRLEPGVDVLGQLEGGSIVVHGGDQAELRVRLDFDAGHDGFHIAAVVE